MTKVLGIHEVELHEGAKEEEFIQAFKKIAKMYENGIGWKLRLLKGDRGKRAGKYAVLLEINSIADRDRFSPAHNVMSQEAQQWLAENREMVEELTEKWAEFSPTDISVHEEYTDYLVIV